MDSLAALRAARAEPELRATDPVPDLKFLAADMTPWSLHGALRSAEAGGAAPVAGVLLLGWKASSLVFMYFAGFLVDIAAILVLLWALEPDRPAVNLRQIPQFRSATIG